MKLQTNLDYRRYVTKLLQPLVKRGVVRRAYILDLKKFDEFSEMFKEENFKGICRKLSSQGNVEKYG